MNFKDAFDGVNRFGGWMVKRFVKKEEIKTRHFNKIKEEVLNHFLDMLRLQEEMDNRIIGLPLEEDSRIERRYKSINKELFKDTLNNHFTEINTIKKELEKKEALFNNSIIKLIKKLKKQFNKEFYEDSVKKFFILGHSNSPNLSLNIDYGGLMYGRKIICNSDEENSKKIKEKLEEIYTHNIGTEIKKDYIKLSKVRQKLISFIEKALASENLKGGCDFIK